MLAPAAARPRAMPSPIPPLPPVTVATRPLRSNTLGLPVRCKAYTGDALVVVLATTPISLRLSVARLRSASLWHGRCTTRARSPRIEPDGGYLNDRRRSTLSPRRLRRLARGAPRLGIRPRRQRAPTRADGAQARARSRDTAGTRASRRGDRVA